MLLYIISQRALGCCCLQHTRVVEENLSFFKAACHIYFHYWQMTVAPPGCNIDKESSFIHGIGRRRRRRRWWWIEGLTWRPDPSPQWGWTIIEGTHRGRELRSRWQIHEAERICWRCLTFFLFSLSTPVYPGRAMRVRCLWGLQRKGLGGGRWWINKLIKL